jgi:hypothetical protein
MPMAEHYAADGFKIRNGYRLVTIRSRTISKLTRVIPAPTPDLTGFAARTSV